MSLARAVALLLALASAAVAQGPKSLASRQSRFAIPFHVGNSTGDSAPAEIRLYVRRESDTGPAGAGWQLAQRVSPQQGAFVFEAPGDGLYSFSIRSVDGAGQEHPSGPHTVGLAVMVDTESPVLRLEANSGPGGEVTARWQATDRQLDPQSLVVEYRTDASSPWRRLALPTGEPQPPGTHNSQATWMPGIRQGVVSIRAQVRDRAGNVADTAREVRLAAEAAPNSRDSRPPLPRGNTYNDPSPGRSPVGHFTAGPATGGDPRWNSAGPTAPVAAPRTTYAQADNAADGAIHWKPDASPPAPRPDADDFANRHSRPAGATRALAGSGPPAGFTSNGPPHDRDEWVGEPNPDRALGAWSGAANNTLARRPSSPARRFPESTTPGSRVHDVSVPVYPSTDSGAAMRLPPLSGGASTHRWAGPDQFRRPQVHLTSATQQGSNILIVWEASDTDLPPRPVTLSFSMRADGQRYPIAGDLPNTGRFAWRIDERVPSKIFLHIEVLDRAGNRATGHLAQPVVVDRRAVGLPGGGDAEATSESPSAALKPRVYHFY